MADIEQHPHDRLAAMSVVHSNVLSGLEHSDPFCTDRRKEIEGRYCIEERSSLHIFLATAEGEPILKRQTRQLVNDIWMIKGKILQSMMGKPISYEDKYLQVITLGRRNEAEHAGCFCKDGPATRGRKNRHHVGRKRADCRFDCAPESILKNTHRKHRQSTVGFFGKRLLKLSVVGISVRVPWVGSHHA